MFSFGTIVFVPPFESDILDIKPIAIYWSYTNLLTDTDIIYFPDETITVDNGFVPMI